MHNAVFVSCCICSRDLMKWCSRIVKDFDVSKSSTSHAVFQEAFDCFCACLADPTKQHALAEAIAAKTNINKAQVK